MSLQHILLGLLKDMPSSGYELNKRLQQEVQHFWISDQSQIYRALYRMQEEGWVEFELVLQQDNPNKKVYHITKSGEAELNDWLESPQQESPLNRLWLARLYFGKNLSNEAIHRFLTARLKTSLSFEKSLERQVALASNENRRLSLTYALDSLRQEVAWIKTTLESISP